MTARSANTTLRLRTPAPRRAPEATAPTSSARANGSATGARGARRPGPNGSARVSKEASGEEQAPGVSLEEFQALKARLEAVSAQQAQLLQALQQQQQQ